MWEHRSTNGTSRGTYFFSSLLEDLLVLARTRYVSPGVMASLYIELGERDNAFRWLEEAYRERSNYMAYLLVDDVHDSITSDPRYKDLLRRVGLQ